MNNKYLIIDKPSRVELTDTLPYAITRLKAAIEENQDSIEYHLNEEINISIISNKIQICINTTPIEEFTHIILRGHHSRRDYEIKQIIVNYIEKHNQDMFDNPDKQIKILNSEFMKVLPHYTKIYQALICSQNNIPFLDTYYKSNGEYCIDNQIDKFNITTDKVILKHYTGKNDLRKIDDKYKIKKNIYLLEKAEDINQPNLINKSKSAFFIQEFVSIGEDIRVFMKKDKFIGGWKRKATESFITVNKGEYSNYNNPSKQILEIAIKTVQAFKSDFMAIDIIEKDGNPYVLEVNMNPGFKAYDNKVNGVIGMDKVDIAKEIISSF